MLTDDSPILGDREGRKNSFQSGAAAAGGHSPLDHVFRASQNGRTIPRDGERVRRRVEPGVVEAAEERREGA